MDYATAKTIFQEVSPNLILEPDSGHAHIVVRKPGKGKPPFSITLPSVAHLIADDDPKKIADSERELLLASFRAAEL